jgi:hypothetical protein
MATSYVDDWVGYADTVEQLHDDFAVFLSVCRKYQITLDPPQNKIWLQGGAVFRVPH